MKSVRPYTMHNGLIPAMGFSSLFGTWLYICSSFAESRY